MAEDQRQRMEFLLAAYRDDPYNDELRMEVRRAQSPDGRLSIPSVQPSCPPHYDQRDIVQREAGRTWYLVQGENCPVLVQEGEGLAYPCPVPLYRFLSEDAENICFMIGSGISPSTFLRLHQTGAVRVTITPRKEESIATPPLRELIRSWDTSFRPYLGAVTLERSTVVMSETVAFTVDYHRDAGGVHGLHAYANHINNNGYRFALDSLQSVVLTLNEPPDPSNPFNLPALKQ